MKRNLPPRIAALLIALMLAGSAGVASAATAAASPPDSWFGYVEQVMVACVSGNPTACMAAAGGAGVVTPDKIGDPSIKNK